MNKQKIIYYTDELNDEFSGADIKPRVIDENYKYFHSNPIWHILAIIFNLLMFPIKVIYPKYKFHLKYIGKEKLKPYKKQGYFIYANHTQPFCDTFITSQAVFPKRNYLIVNPENVSMKFFGNSIQMLGAIPIPTNKKAMNNFLDCVNKHISLNHSITIYPEAHIWPYYTKIRPFKSVSFTYPCKLNVPVFCMTNTYVKRKNSNKINIKTYIDGPFFANSNLASLKEQKEDLRNQVYDCMTNRSKNNNVEFIKYIYKEKGDQE